MHVPLSAISILLKKIIIYLIKTNSGFHFNQSLCLTESGPEELRRATRCQEVSLHWSSPVRQCWTILSKIEKESPEKCLSLQGGNRSFPLLRKTNIVNPPHIRTQILYSLRRILENGLSWGIHSVSLWVHINGPWRPIPITCKEGQALQTLLTQQPS